MINTFLIIVLLYKISPSAEYVMISMIGGSMRANELLAKAPISDINRSKCGTAIAKQTENKNKFLLVLRLICEVYIVHSIQSPSKHTYRLQYPSPYT